MEELFRYDALDATPLAKKPFEYVIVPNFIGPGAAGAAERRLPKSDAPRELSSQRGAIRPRVSGASGRTRGGSVPDRVRAQIRARPHRPSDGDDGTGNVWQGRRPEVVMIPTASRNGPVVQADRNARGQFLLGHTGMGGRPRGARNKLGEAFLQDLHADWEKHGKEVIERVRRDDPSAYLRVMASVVRPASEPDVDDPFAHMTYEELRSDLLAGFTRLFPELRVIPAAGQKVLPGTKDG